MTEDGYSYWVEAFCSDGSYQQTPYLHASAEKDTAPAPYSQQDYQFLLQFLGISDELPNYAIQSVQSSFNKASSTSSLNTFPVVKSTYAAVPIASANSVANINSANISGINLVPPGQFVHYYIWDHLGSTRVIIRRYDSAVVESIKYFPFGQQINGLIEDAQFTGKQIDIESSLHYFVFRYYSPNIFRFLSVDAVTIDKYDTQQWNRYAYALNNPLRYIDPKGLSEAEFKKDEEKDPLYNWLKKTFRLIIEWITGNKDYEGNINNNDPKLRVVTESGLFSPDEIEQLEKTSITGAGKIAKVPEEFAVTFLTLGTKAFIEYYSSRVEFFAATKLPGAVVNKFKGKIQEIATNIKIVHYERGVAVMWDVPSTKVGGKAKVRYVKVVDYSGKTLKIIKTTYDKYGKIYDVKDKLNNKIIYKRIE